MLLFERNVPCPCLGKHHSSDQMHEVKGTKAMEIESSSTDFECDAPPQYRSRFSTLDTLYEDEGAFVRYKEVEA